jgi:hypothetical protein
MKHYKFPVYGTQGGGLAREVNGKYIFVEKPDCPGLDIGDEVPEQWDLIPANQSAKDSEEFARSGDEFFETAFDEAEKGNIPISALGRFFPQTA